jgi:hypothetical protein
MKKRYTIAVDFDGVLHSYQKEWINHHTIPDVPTAGAIGWLNEIQESFDVIIFTTRGKTWRGRRAVKRWLWENGLRQEDAETWSDLRIKITDRKPAALIYLDDRAVRFNGGNWPTADEVYQMRPWNKWPWKPWDK